MPQVVKHIRSAVAGKVPTTAELDLGVLAINTYDGKAFLKKDDGTESIIEVTTPAASTSTAGKVQLTDSTSSTSTTTAATPNAVKSAYDLAAAAQPKVRAVAASGTSGSLTPNSDTTDLYLATGLTGAITLAAPSGTPANGQKLLIRLKDDGTARGITWTTSSGGFRAVGITLPTTTVLGKVSYVGCIYNSTDSYWDAVANVTQA